MDSLDKKYYRMADVTALLGIPATTLRFWEREFPSLHPKRNAGGQRLYTPTDIEQLKVIQFLVKDKGMTIEGARQHLRVHRQGVDLNQRAVERLRQVRQTLTDLIEALDARQRILKKASK